MSEFGAATTLKHHFRRNAGQLRSRYGSIFRVIAYRRWWSTRERVERLAGLRKNPLAWCGSGVIQGTGWIGVDREPRDAGFGSAFGVAILVCRPGEPGAGGSSAAADPGDRERGARRACTLISRRSTRPGLGGRRSRPSGCCARFCCRRSTASGRSARSWSGWSSTCCSAGSSGSAIDDPAWDQTTFGKNRDRLLAGDVAAKFLAAVVGHPKVKRLLSTEHFSVDGTPDRSLGVDEERQAEGRCRRGP